MVEVKDIRISFDFKYLDIWVAVPDGPAYTECLITDIAVVNQYNYTSGYPQNKKNIAFETNANYPIDDYAIKDPKVYKARIPCKMIQGLDDNMFFVYIKTNGLIDPSVGCGCDSSLVVVPVINMKPIIRIKQSFINAYLTDCKKYKELYIDLMIKEDAYLGAVQACNYPLAICLYLELLKRDIDKCVYLKHHSYKVGNKRNCNC